MKKAVTTDMIFRRVRELDKRYLNWDEALRKWQLAKGKKAEREAEVFVNYWKRRYYELRDSKEFPT